MGKKLIRIFEEHVKGLEGNLFRGVAYYTNYSVPEPAFLLLRVHIKPSGIDLYNLSDDRPEVDSFNGFVYSCEQISPRDLTSQEAHALALYELKQSELEASAQTSP